MELIKRFKKNVKGRDFFVGDIHGTFNLLEYEMERISFDKNIDRLFCTGDLFNRGSHEHLIKNFVNKKWFFNCIGNHDDNFLSVYNIEKNDYRVISNEVTLKNRMEKTYNFLKELTISDLDEIIKHLNQSSIMMQVETDLGLIGLIHAEIPAYKSWNESISFFESKEKETNLYREYAFWGDRIYQRPRDIEFLFESIFLTRKDIKNLVSKTAKDLHILYMGHNIVPSSIEDDHSYQELCKCTTNTNHLKFIDHGAFLKQTGVNKKSYGTFIYDVNGYMV